MPSAGCEFFRFLSRFAFLTPSGSSGRKELEVFSGQIASTQSHQPPNPNLVILRRLLPPKDLCNYLAYDVRLTTHDRLTARSPRSCPRPPCVRLRGSRSASLSPSPPE